MCRNVVAKVLRAVHGEEFFGSEDSPICVPGEKSQRYLFSHAATDASLLLAGKTRWAVVAVEKVKRYLLSHAEPFHPCAGTREAVEPR